MLTGLNDAFMKNTRALLNSIEKNIKWQTRLSVVFARATNPDIVTKPPIYFMTEPVTSTSNDPLELQLAVALRRIWQMVDTFERNGSGWIIGHFVALDVHIYNYDPLRAGAHIPLSKNLLAKRAILNIKNSDDDWYVILMSRLLNVFIISFSNKKIRCV